MGLKLDQVVPWGRSLSEYVRMFDLTPVDQHRTLLDCGGGPASFNAEMTQQGGTVISCDPIYQFSAAEIRDRIQATYAQILQGVQANLHCYVWDEIKSPEHLGQIRMAAMAQFLADFAIGLQQGRYRTDALPNLAFVDRQFDLALCSHLLFTYSEQLSYEFHLNSIQELCRIASEVRIFPLLDLSGERSPWLEPAIAELRSSGHEVHRRSVTYEFQQGGNQMLQIHTNHAPKS